MVAHQILHSHYLCLEDNFFIHLFGIKMFWTLALVSAVSGVALGVGETAKKEDQFSCPSVPVWEADQKQVQKTIADTDLKKPE